MTRCYNSDYCYRLQVFFFFFNSSKVHLRHVFLNSSKICCDYVFYVTLDRHAFKLQLDWLVEAYNLERVTRRSRCFKLPFQSASVMMYQSAYVVNLRLF